MSNIEEDAEAIQPSVMPWSYEIHDAVDRQSIRLIIHTVTGQTVLFIPNEFANHFGRDLIQHSTGIVLPSPNGRFTPKGEG